MIDGASAQTEEIKVAEAATNWNNGVIFIAFRSLGFKKSIKENFYVKKKGVDFLSLNSSSLLKMARSISGLRSESSQAIIPSPVPAK